MTITFSLLEERGERLRPRALLIGVLPRRWVDGVVGDCADGLSVVAAIAGTVGPLGFLSLQQPGLPAAWGIKWLSELNVALTLGLAAAILLVGPGLWLIQHFLSGMLLYISNLPAMALANNGAEQGGWINGWTIFYWGWFLGYAPLMGLFTAGVSRGRSLRELVLAVAILCPLVTNLWFTLLGGTGIALELANSGSVSEPLQATGLASGSWQPGTP